MELNKTAVIDLYGSSEKCNRAFTYALTLKENINKAVLENAVKTAIKRYPYYSIKVLKKSDDSELVIKENEAPVIVSEKGKNIKLCSKEANYHIQLIEYFKHTIYFSVHNAFSDAMGYLKFVKSVLYYYITEMYKIQLNNVGVRLYDSRMHEDELENPFRNVDEKGLEIVKKHEEVYHLSKEGKPLNKIRYELVIDEKVFMKLVEDDDVSHGSMLSSVFCEAIYRTDEKDHENVVCKLAHNPRGCLQEFKTYQNITDYIYIPFDMDKIQRDIKRAVASSMGVIILRQEKDSVESRIAKRLKKTNEILSMPNIKEKREAASKYLSRMSECSTFKMNYIGKYLFGNLETYIESIFSYNDTGYDDVDVTVNVLHDKMYISYLQGFDDERYIKHFTGILDELKVPYTISEKLEDDFVSIADTDLYEIAE